MSGFDGDKTALVLGLVATMLGWQTSRITEDIRSTRSVAYWIRQDTDARGRISETIEIENVSKEKMLTRARFEVSCENAACIRRGSARAVLYPPAANRSTIEDNPPIGDEEVITENSEAEKGDAISLTTTIAAGGKVGIRFGLLPGTESPKLFFDPDPDNPIDIYVFDGNSIRGYIVRWYLEIMFFAFISTILLAVAAGTVMWKRRRKPQKAEAGEPAAGTQSAVAAPRKKA